MGRGEDEATHTMGFQMLGVGGRGLMRAWWDARLRGSWMSREQSVRGDGGFRCAREVQVRVSRGSGETA